MSLPVDGDQVEIDIHQLFRDYDSLYFGGILFRNGTVSLRWSNSRMTLCAGLCKYKGPAGGCEIVLSAPLLQFREKKEIQETLLHEMIHALLFITKNCDSHDDHGENFQQKMIEINTSVIKDKYRPVGGYNITIYHSFTDEVEFHRQHHWECNRCGDIIKRSMNRPPTDKDCVKYRKDGSKWKHKGSPTQNPCGLSKCFAHDHIRLCGGEWVKTQQPQQRKRKREEKTEKTAAETPSQGKIEDYFTNGKQSPALPNIDEKSSSKGVKRIKKDEATVPVIDLTSEGDEVWHENLTDQIGQLEMFYYELGFSFFPTKIARETLLQYNGNVSRALDFLISKENQFPGKSISIIAGDPHLSVISEEQLSAIASGQLPIILPENISDPFSRERGTNQLPLGVDDEELSVVFPESDKNSLIEEIEIESSDEENATPKQVEEFILQEYPKNQMENLPKKHSSI